MSSRQTKHRKNNNEPIIRCQSVSKTVPTAEGELIILHDISLDVYTGESVAVVGHSGSGKTTFLSLLGGMDQASSGTIEILQHRLDQLTEPQRTELRNQSIGFVFQSFHLMPGFTALENVMLPLEIRGNVNARPLAEEMLARVSMSHRLNHFPTTLSGGEQQRVAIARAFVTDPPIILADEPTGNLDSQTGATIIELLFAVNQEKNTTLVLVTHDEKISQRCNQIIRLAEGGLLR